MANLGLVFWTPGRIATTADELWNDLGDPGIKRTQSWTRPQRERCDSLRSRIVVVLVYRLFSFWMPTLVSIALVPNLEHRENSA
jgi:hypothetical protein